MGTEDILDILSDHHESSYTDLFQSHYNETDEFIGYIGELNLHDNSQILGEICKHIYMSVAQLDDHYIRLKESFCISDKYEYVARFYLNDLGREKFMTVANEIKAKYPLLIIKLYEVGLDNEDYAYNDPNISERDWLEAFIDIF